MVLCIEERQGEEGCFFKNKRNLCDRCKYSFEGREVLCLVALFNCPGRDCSAFKAVWVPILLPGWENSFLRIQCVIKCRCSLANDPNSNNIEKDNRNSFHIKWHLDITKRPKGLLRHIRYDEVSLFHNPIKYILLLPGQRISLVILLTPLCRSLLNRGSSATSFPGSIVLPSPGASDERPWERGWFQCTAQEAILMAVITFTGRCL